jgi:hypothetical protein
MMKKLFGFTLLISSSLGAQSSFRIFDTLGNDVTGGVIYVADTNASVIQVNLTVENVDSVTRNTTAGRLVISAPVTSQEAFIWDLTQYLPGTDSSVVNEFIPSGDSLPFEGYYFPNGNYGIATINYCFWERTDMNNNSCVAVTFDNYFSAGVSIPVTIPDVTMQPNPAPVEIGIGWSGWNYSTVNLYSSRGELIASHDVRGQYECTFDLRDLPSGIYMISCVEDNGRVFNSRFVH